jgi:DNA-binding MarR family transcriptional regulator
MSRPLTATRAALLPDGDDRQFRRLVHDTLAFAARIEEIRSRLGAVLGLPGSAYTVLMTVAHLEGADGVGVSAVAEHLHLSGAAVTIEVNRLVRLGYVNKRTNTFDRRRVLLRVTEHAHRELDRLTAVQAPANDALFACLDEQSFAVFAGLMHRLVGCSNDALDMLRPPTRQAAG